MRAPKHCPHDPAVTGWDAAPGRAGSLGATLPVPTNIATGGIRVTLTPEQAREMWRRAVMTPEVSPFYWPYGAKV